MDSTDNAGKDVNAPPITGPIIADDDNNDAISSDTNGGSKVWRREGTAHQQDSSPSSEGGGEQLATTKRLLNGGDGRSGYPLGVGIIIGEDALEMIVILCLLGLLVGSLVTSTFLYCRRRAVGRRRRDEAGGTNENGNKNGDASTDGHQHLQPTTFSESLLGLPPASPYGSHSMDCQLQTLTTGNHHHHQHNQHQQSQLNNNNLGCCSVDERTTTNSQLSTASGSSYIVKDVIEGYNGATGSTTSSSYCHRGLASPSNFDGGASSHHQLNSCKSQSKCASLQCFLYFCLFFAHFPCRHEFSSF